jgi:hypothetical protein
VAKMAVVVGELDVVDDDAEQLVNVLLEMV